MNVVPYPYLMIRVILFFLLIPLLSCQKGESLTRCVDGNGPCLKVFNTSSYDFENLHVASVHIGGLESGATSSNHQVDSIFNHVTASLSIDGTNHMTPFACFGFTKYTEGNFTVQLSVIDDEQFDIRTIRAELIESDN